MVLRPGGVDWGTSQSTRDPSQLPAVLESRVTPPLRYFQQFAPPVGTFCNDVEHDQKDERSSWERYDQGIRAFTPFGTATLIAPAVVITAYHVIEEWLQRIKDAGLDPYEPKVCFESTKYQPVLAFRTELDENDQPCVPLFWVVSHFLETSDDGDVAILAIACDKKAPCNPGGEDLGSPGRPDLLGYARFRLWLQQNREWSAYIGHPSHAHKSIDAGMVLDHISDCYRTGGVFDLWDSWTENPDEGDHCTEWSMDLSGGGASGSVVLDGDGCIRGLVTDTLDVDWPFVGAAECSGPNARTVSQHSDVLRAIVRGEAVKVVGNARGTTGASVHEDENGRVYVTFLTGWPDSQHVSASGQPHLLMISNLHPRKTSISPYVIEADLCVQSRLPAPMPGGLVVAGQVPHARVVVPSVGPAAPDAEVAQPDGERNVRELIPVAILFLYRCVVYMSEVDHGGARIGRRVLVAKGNGNRGTGWISYELPISPIPQMLSGFSDGDTALHVFGTTTSDLGGVDLIRCSDYGDTKTVVRCAPLGGVFNQTTALAAWAGSQGQGFVSWVSLELVAEEEGMSLWGRLQLGWGSVAERAGGEWPASDVAFIGKGDTPDDFETTGAATDLWCYVATLSRRSTGATLDLRSTPVDSPGVWSSLRIPELPERAGNVARIVATSHGDVFDLFLTTSHGVLIQVSITDDDDPMFRILTALPPAGVDVPKSPWGADPHANLTVAGAAVLYTSVDRTVWRVMPPDSGARWIDKAPLELGDYNNAQRRAVGWAREPAWHCLQEYGGVPYGWTYDSRGLFPKDRAEDEPTPSP